MNDEAKKHNQNLPGMGGIYDSINFNVYHYAGNNPILYIDPTGEFKTKEFIFATLQTVGGIAEVIGGGLATGVSAGVSIYVMIDGVYTAADGIIGMVAAANDKDYAGMISTVASKVAEKCGASEQNQELVGAYASLADTIIDGIATKGLSIVGDASQTASAGLKIVNSLGVTSSSISETNTYIEAAKETVESIQQYKRNNNSDKQDE